VTFQAIHFPSETKSINTNINKPVIITNFDSPFAEPVHVTDSQVTAVHAVVVHATASHAAASHVVDVAVVAVHAVESHIVESHATVSTGGV